MYESFFDLREKPFSLLPDPSFLFMSDQHQQALTLLEYGLLNQAGFIILTGEIGSGKTTLMRYLLTKLDASYTVGLISNTHQSLGDLMDWVCMALDIHMSNATKLEKYQALVDFIIDKYAKGKRVLLIVDEAQNLGIETLEELRLLSNINSDKDLVLQLMLLGQPQLRDLLRHPDLEQFAQRVASSYHLGRIGSKETESYIRHRILIAGGTHEIFSHDACEAIHHYSKGIPRVINLICDTALVYAYGSGEEFITSQSIDELIRIHMPNLIIKIDNKRSDHKKPEIDKPTIGSAAATSIDANSNAVAITPSVASHASSDRNPAHDQNTQMETPERSTSDHASKESEKESNPPLILGIAPPAPLIPTRKSLSTSTQDPIPIGIPPQEKAVASLSGIHGGIVSLNRKQSAINAKFPQQRDHESQSASYKKFLETDRRTQQPTNSSSNRLLPIMSVILTVTSLGFAAIWFGDSPINENIRIRISTLLKPYIESTTETTNITQNIKNPTIEADSTARNDIDRKQTYLESPSMIMTKQQYTLGTLSTSELKTQQDLSTHSATENQGKISPDLLTKNELNETLPIDNLENQLRQLAESVQRHAPEHLSANLGSLVQFQDGSTQLEPAAKKTLSQIANILKNFHKIQVKIIAHTDSSGSIALNQSISGKRAKAVADYFSELGIPIEQLEYEGRGKSEMKVEPNQESSIGTWVNRRIEIELIDKSKIR
ncbi:hypothetical protein CCR95_15590 [Thiocystis minor]|uniref:AAA family ATPase n=1 Tax=Thiocystis minor TaxID=61597 RepID=UPI001911505B|nr:AAA family ATPase [Thiocystis minor]MBK5965472.1 hypothetical protein [Thiocystis minor]